jgi:hypothetical protein
MAPEKSFDSILSTWVEVMQSINPVWSWWLNSMHQVGFINISHTQTSKPKVEQQIVTKTASYGKQLGRIVEALNVLCVYHHQHMNGLQEEEKKALKALVELAAELAEVKAQADPEAGNLIYKEVCLDYLKNWQAQKAEVGPEGSRQDYTPVAPAMISHN